MSLLLHICCGPCAAYPVTLLQAQGMTLRGFFYNPNIHPFREFKRRLAAVEQFVAASGLRVDYQRQYGLTGFLRQVVFHETGRCALCYAMRLTAAAEQARLVGAEAFTTTLLYSRYQKHGLIRKTGEAVAEEYGVPFYYQDFREGWQQGIDLSLEMGLYRQAYCGCIYSEQERYDKDSAEC
ncbi:MAG: epoxyqueuosine reductase QueH [Desulfobacterales bacterium]|nr:epoxyqueuosine reductase QueH [Desulfobacterales bacterium]